MLTVTCVIPSACTPKSLPLLDRCLRSLIAARAGRCKLNVFVVTQRTHIPTGSCIRRATHVISASRTDGFASMNNLAIEESIKRDPSDYYLFINDDAWVEKNFFSEMKKLVRHSSADIISPLIYRADRREIDSFGIEYFRSGYAKNSTSLETKTSLATAACLAVKTSFLKKMKRAYGFYFNPILYYYLEDVELSIRAAALDATFVKSSSLVAIHVGSATSRKKSYFTMYHTYRNIIWVILLTWPVSAIADNMFSILLVLGWTSLYSLRSFGPKLYLSLWGDTLAHIKSLMVQRKRILNAYAPAFRFSHILSPYAFRTYHGITI